MRLGYCALGTRGVAQVYFDDIPQGEPLDMRKSLDDVSIMGSAFSEKSYTSMTDEEKAEDQKTLKNKGYYRAPWGMYHSDGNVINDFTMNARTYRRVLCEQYIDNTQEHYLRLQCISESTTGNNFEMQLDYIELVPKSVYDVPEGEMEDDL